MFVLNEIATDISALLDALNKIEFMALRENRPADSQIFAIHILPQLLALCNQTYSELESVSKKFHTMHEWLKEASEICKRTSYLVNFHNSCSQQYNDHLNTFSYVKNKLKSISGALNAEAEKTKLEANELLSTTTESSSDKLSTGGPNVLYPLDNENNNSEKKRKPPKRLVHQSEQSTSLNI